MVVIKQLSQTLCSISKKEQQPSHSHNSSYDCLKMNCSLLKGNRKGTVPFTERTKLEEHGVPLTNTKSVHLLKGTVPFTDRNKLDEHGCSLKISEHKIGPLTKRNHLLA